MNNDKDDLKKYDDIIIIIDFKKLILKQKLIFL